jgi:hypothetical protein
VPSRSTASAPKRAPAKNVTARIAMTIICLSPVPGRPLAAGASACRAGFRVSPGRFRDSGLLFLERKEK